MAIWSDNVDLIVIIKKQPEKKNTLPPIVLPKKSNPSRIKCLSPAANLQEIEQTEQHTTLHQECAISKVRTVAQSAVRWPGFFHSQIVRERKEWKRNVDEKNLNAASNILKEQDSGIVSRNAHE